MKYIVIKIFIKKIATDKKFRRNNEMLSEKIKILRLMRFSAIALQVIVHCLQGSLNASSSAASETLSKFNSNLYKDTPYLDAVRHGDILEIQQFLSDPLLDINQQNSSGETDLMLVLAMIAIYGQCRDKGLKKAQDIFNLLMQQPKRDWNLRNNNGETALWQATSLRLWECFNALLQVEAVDPNIPDQKGFTPLTLLIEMRKGSRNDPDKASLLEIIKCLLQCERVDVNQEGDGGITPLILVIKLQDGLLLSAFLECRRFSLVACQSHSLLQHLGNPQGSQFPRNTSRLFPLEVAWKQYAYSDRHFLPIFDLIYQRILSDVDMELMRYLKQVKERLSQLSDVNSTICDAQDILQTIAALYETPVVIKSYECCSDDILIKAIRYKINFISNLIEDKNLPLVLTMKRMSQLGKIVTQLEQFLICRNQQNLELLKDALYQELDNYEYKGYLKKQLKKL
jgi:ankyrin repeat protein